MATLDNEMLWIIGGILLLIVMSGSLKHTQQIPVNPEQYPWAIRTMITNHAMGSIVSFNYNGRKYYETRTNNAIGSGSTIYNESGERTGECNASLGPLYEYDICKDSYRENLQEIYTNWNN